MANPGDITELLQKATQGDETAMENLYRLVEKDLRAIAVGLAEGLVPPELDVTPTMLINDAFLKLIGSSTTWHAGDRKKFFGFASKKMHEQIIQIRRAENAEKRGGEYTRIENAEEWLEDKRTMRLEDRQFLMDLQEVLYRFEAIAADDTLIFRLRFFLGCTFAEIGEIMSISTTDSRRGYGRATSWLKYQMKLRQSSGPKPCEGT